MHAFCLLVNMTVEQYITTIYIYGCIQLNVIKSLTNKYIALFFGWIFWWSTILSLLNGSEWTGSEGGMPNLQRGLRPVHHQRSKQDVFKEAAPPCQEALDRSEYNYQLSFKPTPPQTRKKKNRKRNVTYFIPPYSANVKTKIGQEFFKIISELSQVTSSIQS